MKKLILIFAVLITVFQWNNLLAQPEPGSIRPGKMMVQMQELEKLQNIEAAYSHLGMEVERILSHRLRIALLSYDESKVHADALLNQLRSLNYIVQAQHDHIVALRAAQEDSIPDDPYFGLQWGLHNTGQSGGVPGADIDALKAWEITKGGLTAHGDTIVVAVIDGGCDINHEDLNLFKNWNEIPGNGIDDDGNGYIDDFHGWNAYNNTGNIPLSNHGTHVAGTVGAIGNNETGVTGVNWEVKVMPIAGSSGFESTVVAAYSYVYDMRALYDETDGEYGAFVVATNSSFGVDFGQPENYPIWGAMYDSMGALGILSAAATANRNINIDQVGDVPTAFPSPYLLSVTNTTRTDQRNSGAAYGLETIDLGAPGTQIYSTRNNNTYGYSTGTSMATPHVAGAVALLLSAADSAFISMYKQNPSETAQLLRQYILDGTDSLPSLNGLVASGGRLNVYNAIQLMLGSGPELAMVLDTLAISLERGKVMDTTLYAYNTGSGTLQVNVTIPNQPDWVLYYPTAGEIPEGDSLAIQLAFNSAGLDEEIYHATLEVNAANGQSKTVAIQFHVIQDIVGLDESSSSELRLSVHPNPFRERVSFRIDHAEESVIEIRITDLQGNQVKTTRLKPMNGSGYSWDWNGANQSGQACAAGIYFYSISSEQGPIKTGKLILQP